ncbi:MAG: hypothetical protein JWO02_124 [Solirubrobacterales bacterium]|nr:hypothetical protein [Solirubrobacterales bacterium]
MLRNARGLLAGLLVLSSVLFAIGVAAGRSSGDGDGRAPAPAAAHVGGG